MYAILAHRQAGGDEVDGQSFEHQRWTLVDALTPALEAAGAPEPGQIQPRLRIIEVEGDGDPRLAGRAIVGQDAPLSIGDAEEDIDLDQASLASLKKLAKLLGISRSQGRADLIAAIREKHAALDQAERSSLDAAETASGVQAEAEDADPKTEDNQ